MFPILCTALFRTNCSLLCIDERRNRERENSPSTVKSRHDDKSEIFHRLDNLDRLASLPIETGTRSSSTIYEPARREINAVSSRSLGTPSLPTRLCQLLPLAFSTAFPFHRGLSRSSASGNWQLAADGKTHDAGSRDVARD